MILNFCFLPLPEDDCDSDNIAFVVVVVVGGGVDVMGKVPSRVLGDLLGWDLVSSNLDSEIAK